MECELVENYLSGVALVEECDIVSDGALRLVTPFLYPNGAQIDLFLKEERPLLGEFILSDFGQTAEYLLDLQIKPWSTKRRGQVIDDICETLRVKQNGAQLEIHLLQGELTGLSGVLMRLAQACIRVADLALTQRLHTPSAFKEEVEEFIDWLALPYETPYELTGKFDKPVSVDYFVQGRQTKSLLQTLSTPSSQAAHGTANEVFRRWYDLTNVKNQYGFLTVYDSNNNALRDEDFARLSDISIVMGFPAQTDALRTSLIV